MSLSIGTTSGPALRARRVWNIDQWGSGYFDVDDSGHALVRPLGSEAEGPALPLGELVTELKQAGLRLPVLVEVAEAASGQRPRTVAIITDNTAASVSSVRPMRVRKSSTLTYGSLIGTAYLTTFPALRRWPRLPALPSPWTPIAACLTALGRDHLPSQGRSQRPPPVAKPSPF